MDSSTVTQSEVSELSFAGDQVSSGVESGLEADSSDRQEGTDADQKIRHRKIKTPTSATTKLVKQKPEKSQKQIAQQQTRYIIEIFLVLLPAAIVIYRERDIDLSDPQNIVLAHSVQVWVACLALSLTYCYHKGILFTNALYLALIPPLVAYTTKTPAKMLLPMNICLAANILPYPSVVMGIIYDFNIGIPSLVLEYVAPPFRNAKSAYLYVSESVSSLTKQSLTEVEKRLLSVLIVNAVCLQFFGNLPSKETALLQCLFLGSVFCIFPTYPWVEQSIAIMRTPKHRRAPDWEKTLIKHSVWILTTFFVLMFLGTAPVCSYILGINPFEFMWNHISSYGEGNTRLYMMAYWALFVSAIPAIDKIGSRLSLSVDFRRKIWHFCVVGMFLPFGVNTDATFTMLAMGCTLVLFIWVEFIRATALYPIGSQIHEALLDYVDERDTVGPLVVSHIYLLLGIFLPILFHKSPIGIICLGLGDSAASIVGRNIGTTKWFDTNKSVQGTLAFIIMASAGIYTCQQAIPGYAGSVIASLSVPKILAVTTATALLEANADINDNVVVPVYMYILSEVLA